jgi:hypothetical protein
MDQGDSSGYQGFEVCETTGLKTAGYDKKIAGFVEHFPQLVVVIFYVDQGLFRSSNSPELFHQLRIPLALDQKVVESLLRNVFHGRSQYVGTFLMDKSTLKGEEGLVHLLGPFSLLPEVMVEEDFFVPFIAWFSAEKREYRAATAALVFT